MISAGAAVSDVAPGNIALQAVTLAEPGPTPWYTFAIAAEVVDHPGSWDFIVDRAVCTRATG